VLRSEQAERLPFVSGATSDGVCLLCRQPLLPPSGTLGAKACGKVLVRFQLAELALLRHRVVPNLALVWNDA
jgi:hypothetical protein